MFEDLDWLDTLPSESSLIVFEDLRTDLVLFAYLFCFNYINFYEKTDFYRTLPLVAIFALYTSGVPKLGEIICKLF
jgi:hypothetical protein